MVWSTQSERFAYSYSKEVHNFQIEIWINIWKFFHAACCCLHIFFVGNNQVVIFIVNIENVNLKSVVWHNKVLEKYPSWWPSGVILMMMMMFLTSLDVIRWHHQLSTIFYIFLYYIMSERDKKWVISGLKIFRSTNELLSVASFILCYSLFRTIGKEKKTGNTEQQWTDSCFEFYSWNISFQIFFFFFFFSNMYAFTSFLALFLVFLHPHIINLKI